MKQNTNFKRRGGVQTKNPSMGRVWICSGTIQYNAILGEDTHTCYDGFTVHT